MKFIHIFFFFEALCVIFYSNMIVNVSQFFKLKKSLIFVDFLYFYLNNVYFLVNSIKWNAFFKYLIKSQPFKKKIVFFSIFW